MNKQQLFIFIISLFFCPPIMAQETPTKYQKDFEDYWTTVKNNFAYFDRQQTDWEKVKTIYQPIVDTITNKKSFIRVLENCNHELYNNHVGLNTNLTTSNKLAPTNADLWAAKEGEKIIIKALRKGYNAETAGLEQGMEITEFNDQPILKAIEKYLPKSLAKQNENSYEYAINLLLAGTHNTPRKITAINNGKVQNFYPDKLTDKYKTSPAALLESKILKDNIGYIQINNSLGDIELIAAFDKALDELMDTKGLILDLRETPSGGNNTIAKGIMGRFIKEEKPYQRYRYINDEDEADVAQIWVELVIPRGKHYDKPLVVLCNYWTGSMGEGITIGLDAMERATIVGTKMARLLGATWSFDLAETGIGYQFPGIQLFHIDKQPREDFVPAVEVETEADYLEQAKEIINK